MLGSEEESPKSTARRWAEPRLLPRGDGCTTTCRLAQGLQGLAPWLFTWVPEIPVFLEERNLAQSHGSDHYCHFTAYMCIKGLQHCQLLGSLLALPHPTNVHVAVRLERFWVLVGFPPASAFESRRENQLLPPSINTGQKYRFACSFTQVFHAPHNCPGLTTPHRWSSCFFNASGVSSKGMKTEEGRKPPFAMQRGQILMGEVFPSSSLKFISDPCSTNPMYKQGSCALLSPTAPSHLSCTWNTLTLQQGSSATVRTTYLVSTAPLGGWSARASTIFIAKVASKRGSPGNVAILLPFDGGCSMLLREPALECGSKDATASPPQERGC